MKSYRPVSVRVWGDLACFTRPELKVERVSYPVMTPSVARGILEAIFWKPEFSWKVIDIQVLAPVRWLSFRRNEVKSIKPLASVRDWATSGIGSYVAEEDRDQRHTLALRDVAYLINAEPMPHSQTLDDSAKYRDQFRRRVDRGQCYSQPFLGCREFSASFGLAAENEQPIDWDEDLGLMFWGFDYGKQPAGSLWFEAAVDSGILRVPPEPQTSSSAAVEVS